MERGEAQSAKIKAQGKAKDQNSKGDGALSFGFLICLELWALSFELGGVRTQHIVP